MAWVPISVFVVVAVASTALVIMSAISFTAQRTPVTKKAKKKKSRKTNTADTNTTVARENSSGDGESQNLLNLLYSIAEDQARKEGYVHRGLTCNSCGTTPIRGIRFKCANCVDYDLCEACEATESHLPQTHVFLKIRIPIPPLANPRTALTPVLYPGTGKALSDAALTWDDLKELQKKTHFDHVELEALYEQFKSLCPADGRGGISWRVFEHCLGPLGLERNLITERIFDFFDQDCDGVINFPELVCGLSILCKGTQEEKTEYIFKGYDLDNDGFISKRELESMFQAYFKLSLELIKDVAKALQHEIILRYDDQSDKPVSATFTLPIPNEDGQSSISKQKTVSSGDKMTEPLERSNSTSSLQWPTAGRLKPVMETLSDEAIKELVERTFRAADTAGTGLISFESFKQFALTDSTVTAWFEALGSVF